jgi:hypothetical protein
VKGDKVPAGRVEQRYATVVDFMADAHVLTDEECGDLALAGT